VVADSTAAGSDPAAIAAILVQLRRAKGQVAGIERMVEGGRACAEIVTQIIAARASLLAVAKAALREHMRQNHASANRHGGMKMDAMYQELVDLLTKMAR
jgi:DNA-binding FrmR family transcriptional regulator